MRNASILYVADDEKDAWLMRRAFEAGGDGPLLQTVADSAQAIRALARSGLKGGAKEEASPCLVLLDLQRSAEASLQVVEWIRARPALNEVVLILFTDSQESFDATRACALRVNAVVPRPANLKQLVEFADLLRDYWLDLSRDPELAAAKCPFKDVEPDGSAALAAPLQLRDGLAQAASCCNHAPGAKAGEASARAASGLEESRGRSPRPPAVEELRPCDPAPALEASAIVQPGGVSSAIDGIPSPNGKDATRRTTWSLGSAVVIVMVVVCLLLANLVAIPVNAEGRFTCPPDGLVVAVFMLFGYRWWPAILLGELALGLIAGNRGLALLVLAVAGVVKGLAGAGLIQRFAGGRYFYRQPLNVVKFAVVVAVTCALLGPSVLAPKFSFHLFGGGVGTSSAWMVWWLAGMTSALVVAPVVVLWSQRSPVVWNRAQAVEVMLLLALSVLGSVGIFADFPVATAQGFLLPYLCLPFPIWAAFRMGSRETALVSFVLAAVSRWGTLQGAGWLGRAAPEDAVMAYEAFMALSSVMGLVVAAVVAQRAKAQSELKHERGQLEHRVWQRARSLREEIERRKLAEETVERERDLLEFRVSERTDMLIEANRVLNEEVLRRRQTAAELSRVLERLVDAQEVERGRISRELHDEVGQKLTAMKLVLKASRDRAPRDAVMEERVANLEESLDGLMQDMHRLAWALRPPVLDDFGLSLALRRYVEEWSQQSGIEAQYHQEGMEGPRLPSKLETTLYRVLQEALNNALKHADARRVSVLLQRRGDNLSLIVEDDGKGFDAAGALQSPLPSGKLGLLGMKERMMLVDGALEIEGFPESGTTVYARVPLQRPSAAVSGGYEEVTDTHCRRP